MLQLLVRLRGSAPPESLLRAITTSLLDRYYGLEALALASVIERAEHTPKLARAPRHPWLRGVA